MKNWKTTTLGWCAIVGALLHLATTLLNGKAPTMDELGADWTAVMAGWGLIHAADSSKGQQAQ